MATDTFTCSRCSQDKPVFERAGGVVEGDVGVTFDYCRGCSRAKAERSDYCWSIDGDSWHVSSMGRSTDPGFDDGPFTTRERALNSARSSHPEATKIETAECAWEGNERFFDAEDILEQIADHSSSEVEDSDGYPDVSKEATAELQSLLDAWTKKYLPDGPGWYECHDRRVHELVDGEWKVTKSDPVTFGYPASMLTLFQIERDGALHWVIASNSIEALYVANEYLGRTGQSTFPIGATKVEPVQIAVAERLAFASAADPSKPSMLDEARRDIKRRYVACSEY